DIVASLENDRRAGVERARQEIRGDRQRLILGRGVCQLPWVGQANPYPASAFFCESTQEGLPGGVRDDSVKRESGQGSSSDKAVLGGNRSRAIECLARRCAHPGHRPATAVPGRSADNVV